MPGPRRSSSSANRQWRPQTAAGTLAASNSLRRVLLGLLVLILTVVLGYGLYLWLFLPKLHLVCMPVESNNLLAASL